MTAVGKTHMDIRRAGEKEWTVHFMIPDRFPFSFHGDTDGTGTGHWV